MTFGASAHPIVCRFDTARSARGQDRRRAAEDALGWLQRLGVEIDPRRKPVAISGGQAQRVAVCRALLPQPRILLADEPTGNLDDASASRVIDELAAAAASGMSVVVATHDRRVASRCDERMDLRA